MYAPNPEGGEEAGVPLKQPPLTATHINPNLGPYSQAQYRYEKNDHSSQPLKNVKVAQSRAVP